MRICSMWGVICIHVGSSVVQPIKGTVQYIVFLIQGMPLNCCVPLFYMMSGMLILQKTPDLKAIWTRKIPRLVAAIIMRLIFIAIVILTVAFMGYIVYGRPFRWEVFKDFATRDNIFLYSLIGLYVISPFLYFVCLDKKYEEYFLLLSLFFSIIVPTLQKVTAISLITTHIFSNMSVFLPLGYSLLFVLGHYLAKYIFPKIANYKFIVTVLMIIGIAADYIIRINSITWLQTGTVSYGSLCELVICIPIFCFFGVVVSCWNPQKENFVKLIQHMGRNSIAIFVLHWAVINLDRAVGINPSCGYYLIGRPMETTFIFLICYGISLIWERIPFLNKIIVA